MAQLERDQDQLRKSFGDVAESLLTAVNNLTAKVAQIGTPAAVETAPEAATAAPKAHAAHEPHHQQKKHK
jgi:hypothetical protein